MFIFEMIFCVKFNSGLLEDLFPRTCFSFMDCSIQAAVVMPFSDIREVVPPCKSIFSKQKKELVYYN